MTSGSPTGHTSSDLPITALRLLDRPADYARVGGTCSRSVAGRIRWRRRLIRLLFCQRIVQSGEGRRVRLRLEVLS
jgi:hypothetical protein